MRVNPITASIAHELQHIDDDYITRVACWFLAYKFEESDYICYDDLLEICDFLDDDSSALLEAEHRVLNRQNYMLPFRTCIRNISDSLNTFDTKKKEVWLHVITFTRMTKVFTVEEWVHRFKRLLLNTHLDPIFQVVASMLQPHMRECLNIPKHYLGFCSKKRQIEAFDNISSKHKKYNLEYNAAR